MRWIVYGAGAIGGTIGARLHMSGAAVVLIARGAHAEVLQRNGLRFIHPEGEEQLSIPCVAHPSKLSPQANDCVLLAMKTQHTQIALADLLAAGFVDSSIFCVQNGVANERMASRLFANVYATLVNLPALHLEPGIVAAFAQGCGGVLSSGAYPKGVDGVLEAATTALTNAGFYAEPTRDIMVLKYSKLLANLGNALELLLTDRAEFGDASRALRAEAMNCYDAAGIEFMPLKKFAELANARFTTVDIADVPRTGGSTLQSLLRGAADVETDYLNGEIVLLGKLHGVATPLNQRVQALARAVISKGQAANSLRWEQLAQGE